MDMSSIVKSSIRSMNSKELGVSISITLAKTMMISIGTKTKTMVANSNRDGMSSDFLGDLSSCDFDTLNYRSMGNGTSRGKCKRGRNSIVKSSIRSMKAK